MVYLSFNWGNVLDYFHAQKLPGASAGCLATAQRQDSLVHLPYKSISFYTAHKIDLFLLDLI